MYGYVYETVNLVNGKKYLGQKKGNFQSSYFGSGNLIKRAIKKYGKENFKVRSILFLESREELNDFEKRVILKFNASESNDFYNIAKGGNTWGSPHTQETKQKISKATTGRVAHNKGKPNPLAKGRMLKNNPMKDPEIVAKARKTFLENGHWLSGRPFVKGQTATGRPFVKGQTAHNKITEMFIWVCEQCGYSEERNTTVKIKSKRFCGKSCAASYSNSRRYLK